MALDTDLGPLTDLAESLGILIDGTFNPSWFENPLGNAGSDTADGSDGAAEPGLTTTLYDDRQREALIAFADEALGSPDRQQVGDAVWLPLVSDTGLTLHAVIEEPPDRPLHVGIGAEYSVAAGGVELSVTAHVRAFQIERQGHGFTGGGGPVPWLLLGQPDGTIDLRVELTNTTASTPGEFHLGGASISGTIPTSASGDLSVDVTLTRLQLPGADGPRDHRLELDSLDTAAADVLGFIVGLVKAQADAIDETDPATRPFAALASLIGLRTTAGIDDFPVADLIERGVDPLVEWVETTLLTITSRNAWLAELAELLGGTAEPDRGSVRFNAGPVSVRVGVATATGASGSAIVTPWTELSLSARDGGDVRIRADLFSVDTTTGAASAFPVIDAAAVFGALATNGSVLLDDGVEIGTVEIGLRVADGSPAFALVARDVELPSGVGHEVVDLSSPEAVRDVAESVVGSELTDLIETLGDAGTVINRVLGLAPPAGVTGVGPVALLTQPLPTIAGYWDRLVAAPAALASVIEELARLIISPSVSLAGAGTPTDPWTVPLGEAAPSSTGTTSAVLMVWLDGSTVAVDVVIGRTTAVLDIGQVRLDGRAALARIDVSTPTVDLLTAITGRLELATADGSPLAIDLNPASVAVDALAVNVGWRSRADRSGGGHTATGLAVTFEAPGLAVDLRPLGGGRHDIPLPRFEADGSLSWDPDWSNVEDLLVSLLDQANDPTLTGVLELIGWLGDGAYLPLAELIVEPMAALKRWLADLVLDCDNTVTALIPLTELLSGFTVHRPLGFGSRQRPYRAPIAGEHGAPGVSVWLDPPCPLPDSEAESESRPGTFDAPGDDPGPGIVAALHHAADALTGIGDLLVGRPGLADGLGQLVERLTGTDGVIGRPETLPVGVTGHDAAGYGYRSLVALGAIDRLGPLLLGDQPTNRLYVGIEPEWESAFDASVDRSTIEAVEAAAGFVPPAGPESWSARLPSSAAARRQRPDRDAVDEQAQRIVDLVAGRTTPVTVIAYGQAGAAAVRAAGITGAITRIVTVGCPWSEPATDAFALGPAGDAIRFLNRLAAPPPDLPETAMALEASPLATLENILERLSPTGAPPVSPAVTDLVDASIVPAPTGIPIDAVFGRLDGDDLWSAISSLVELGIEDRYEVEYGDEFDVGDPEDDNAEDGGPAPDELHLGLDLPALDLDLGGLTVGAGARLEAYRFDRDGETGELRVHDEQDLILTFHFGLTDRWLVGGPTSASTDIEVRWVELRTTLPLDDRPSHTAVVLHEARCFDVFRERWEIDAEQLRATTDATTSLPEVHLILGEVVRRLGSALPEVATGDEDPTNAVIDLLTALGITRNRGYDPAGFERFLFSPAESVAILLDDPVAAAGLIRELGSHAPTGSGPSGTGSSLEWTIESDGSRFTVTTDLASRSLAAGLTRTVVGLAPVELLLALDATGLGVSLGIGSVEPEVGGLEVRASVTSADLAADRGPQLLVRWAAPAASTVTEVDLVRGPGLTTTERDRLIRLVAATVPAALARVALELLRRRVGTAELASIDAVLRGLNLLDADAVAGELDELDELDPTEVILPVRLPIGLFLDPLGWLRTGADRWRSEPLREAVGLLDALAPLAGVTTPAPTDVSGERRWSIGDTVSVRYALIGDRLGVGIAVETDHVVDGRTVTTAIDGGIALSSSGAGAITVAPAVTARFDVDGRGLRLLVDPAVSLAVLRTPPAPPLTLYPWAGDVGGLVASTATMVVPQVLNALIARRSDATASLTRSVAQVVFDLGGALALLESGQFTEDRIIDFADDPVGALTDHVAAVGQVAVNSLVDALDDGGGGGLVRRDGDRLVIGPTGPDRGHLGFTFDDSQASPAVVVDGRLAVDDVGAFTIDELRLRPDGLQVTATYIGDFEVGDGLTLRPVISASAGVTSTSFTRSLTGALALDGAGDRTVGFRWGLDGTPPVLVGTAPVGQPSDPALNLGLFALSLATSIAVDLASPILGPRARPALRGVLLDPDGTGTDATIDPAFFVDLFDVDAVIRRLFRLLANLGDAGLSVTIGSNPALEIGYFADSDSGFNHYGLSLSLGGTGRFKLTDDPVIELEVDDEWIDGTEPAGLTLVGVRQSIADPTDFDFAPRIIARGLGIRVGQQSGPLLELGSLGLDAIALHLYGESNPSGAGLGFQLRLDGIAFAPTGGGDNQVASGIMDDAAEAGGTDARPSFSPGLAVQRPPGADGEVFVSLSAGRPPGPWWLVIQRELGPLYLERFGFDSVTTAGRVTEISLLFDGRVSLFGLTAQVDELAIRWLGGPVTEGDSWKVDIRGFAITADLSGIFISGGLLKTELNGQPGYLGMLMGRFSAYGMSLFGGYTQVGDTPSFFIFGAVNGPIGGPPAFFVTGLGGGLGINRGLRVPDDIARMGDYPFIRALDTGSTSDTPPLDQIRELDEYFPVEMGNIWFAAGLSFTSFSLVDGIAVVSVSFGSGLDINLMGLARMALPRPEAALVSIELGLLARFSTEEGLFLIQAQLTDNSWLLYPEVRLTGGFAFATWWKGPNAGQFVLTLGGYHPTFSRAGYPEVPRLGLVWQVSDEIVIKGGTYFALTSEALMAGLDVEVSADFGFAWARLAFGAHGIVYFDPFWFQVHAYVAISAGIKIKTFLGTIRISISLSASVLVEGPDVSGVATIEVGPAEFDVPFGSRRKDKRPAISWSDFVSKYLEEAAPGLASALSAVAGVGAVPAATGDGDNAPSPDGSTDKPFQVFAEFELTVVTTIPFTAIEIHDGGPEETTPVPVPPTRGDGSASALGLSPMQARSLESELHLSLSYEVADGVYQARASKMGDLVDGLTVEPAGGRASDAGSTFGYNGFPLGVWGRPNDAEAEVKPLPSPEVVFAGNRVTLVSAARLIGLTGPQIVYRQVDHGRRPLPLSASGSSRSNMLGLAAALDDVDVVTAEQAVATARQVLFGTVDSAGTNGLSNGTGRSRLARAAYRGSRTAPPMFGTLTEGFDLSNPEGAGSATIDPTPIVDRRPVRSPRIIGYVGAGSGRSPKNPTTTVADRKIARRPAPSTASVKRRFGKTLAVDLNRTPVIPSVTDATVTVRSATPHTGDVSPWVETDRRLLEAMTETLQVGTRRFDADATADAGAAASGDVGLRLVAGEAVVLDLPDDDVDLDGDRRPTLAVDGSARVVAIGADGTVLADEIHRGRNGNGARSWPAPVGTSRVVALAGPGPDRAATAGWIDGSRLLWTGQGAAVGLGCVVRFGGGGRPLRVGWQRAGALAMSADTVTTTFARAPATVAIVLSDDRPVDPAAGGLLAGVAVAFDGLRPRRPDTDTDTDGDTPVRPEAMIQAGACSVVVVPVEVDPDHPGRPPRVRTDLGRRRVVGVLGSDLTPEALADAVVADGPQALVADPTARPDTAVTEVSTVAWIPAPTDQAAASVHQYDEKEAE